MFDTTLHVRSAGDPAALTEMVRAQVKSLDAHLPLYGVKTLAVQIDDSLIPERLITWLSTIFGLLATLLAAVGLYGVVSFSVTRRTREIGVRIALGAMPGDVLWLISEADGRARRCRPDYRNWRRARCHAFAEHDALQRETCGPVGVYGCSRDIDRNSSSCGVFAGAPRYPRGSNDGAALRIK